MLFGSGYVLLAFLRAGGDDWHFLAVIRVRRSKRAARATVAGVANGGRVSWWRQRGLTDVDGGGDVALGSRGAHRSADGSIGWGWCDPLVAVSRKLRLARARGRVGRCDGEISPELAKSGGGLSCSAVRFGSVIKSVAFP